MYQEWFSIHFIINRSADDANEVKQYNCNGVIFETFEETENEK